MSSTFNKSMLLHFLSLSSLAADRGSVVSIAALVSELVLFTELRAVGLCEGGREIVMVETSL